MGKIFYIIGKSATGKDYFCGELLKDPELKLKEIVQYTTRPKRAGETEGVEYHFVSDEKERELQAQGKIIEEQVYQTIHGPWKYFLADDGQIDLRDGRYIIVGTVERYKRTRDYYGESVVVPINIYVETGERLTRALNREKKSPEPKYQELCRRFLADEADFSDEKLAEAGLMPNGVLKNGIENIEKSDTVRKIKEIILKNS